MANFYDQYLVTVCMIREETAGARAFRYGPDGKDTQVAAGTTMYGLPVIVRDSVEIPIPIREREEYHGIGSGKYPSKIVNKSAEPVTFTIEGPLQIGTFLGYAIGECFSSAGSAAQAEVTYIDCLALADIAAASYFQIYDSTDAHYVWMDTTDGDSDPQATGTGLECVIHGASTATTVAVIVAAAINGDASFTATSSGERVTVTGATSAATADAYDVSTLFRIMINEQGCASGAAIFAHRITELVTNEMESFTLHVEMRNAVSGVGQDILYDLFGCVVNSLEIEAEKSTGTVTCRAEITAASWIAGVGQTTKVGELAIEPFVWADMVTIGTTGYRLLDENVTERCPASIEKILLRINNNIDMKSTVGDPYALYPVSGKREVELEITGFTQNKDLYDFWKGTYDNVTKDMNSATSKMSAHLIFQKTASTDFINIQIYNMYLPTDGHNLTIQTIDDSIAAVDLKLRCGNPDINKRQLYTTIVDGSAKTYYQNEAE